ncbi:MAG: rod-binding protein, partial [Bdellovibrionales bacterium]|nr:rod-binding protein [Bdellovibrionales bacterium]
MSGPLPVKNTFSLTQQQPTREAQEKRLREAAELYERHFLNEMVKAMRKTVPEGQGVLPGSFAEKLYRDQLDQQYVEAWGKKGGVGLGELIYQQLQEKVLGGMRPIGNPQGPVPLTPGKSGQGPIRLEKATESKGSMQLLLDGTQQQGAVRIPVTSPWSGRVAEAFQSAEG